MAAHDNKPQPDPIASAHRPPIDMTHLNIGLANAKTTERAVRCELQLQAFKKKPALMRFFLGGFLTRALLELRADEALVDYLNEVANWH